jgi:beta-phosphoglucomutase
MIKGFFFDLDGTLVDTYKADYLAYRDAIKEVLGIEVGESEFARTHGQEMRQKFLSLKLDVGEEQALQVAAAKKTYYTNYIDLTKPNEELIRFLANFAEHHAIVLVTTAKRQNALSVLKKHGIDQYFSHLVFGEEVQKPKPDPEAYQLALSKSGLKPEEVVAFEDTEIGMQAAEAAGIPVIYVRTFK